jgi:hypothetical protein
MSKFILSSTQPYLLYVNSKNRLNPDTTRSTVFKMPLAAPPLHISRVSLLTCIIPNTIYVFRYDIVNGNIVANNYFDFVDSTGINSFQITPGTYNSSQLITELLAKFAAVSPDTYTITYDPITLKLNITSNFASFQILGATGPNVGSNCLYLLGFKNIDTVAGLSQTAPNALNIQGPREVFIRCSQFQPPIHDCSNSFVAIFQVSLTAGYGEINFYEQFNRHASELNITTTSLTTLDVELVDEFGQLIVMDSDWSFIIRFD